MNYLYSLLIKIAVFLILMQATFTVWKTDSPGVLYWTIPVIALFWLVSLIFETVQVTKNKRWNENKEEDERTILYRYKAGYITFWYNIGFLTILFFFYSYGLEMIKPMQALAAVVLLNIIIYFGTKLYFIFFK